MQKIRVETPEYNTSYDASKWVIDDNGRLHILGTSGNVASFNAAQWLAVEFVD